MKFTFDEKIIVLNYSPINGVDIETWPLSEFNKEEIVKIKNFMFSKRDILQYDDYTIKFIFGRKEKEHYKILAEIVNCKNNIMISNPSILNEVNLITGKYKNIFQSIENARKTQSDLIIGGSNCNISNEDFTNLLNKFPKSYEIIRYYENRVDILLSNYFEDTLNNSEKYNNYMNKRNEGLKIRSISEIKKTDIFKYEYILKILQENILKCSSISEADWKKFIAEVLLLLFPKYINYHQEVYVKLMSDDRGKKREFLDFMLVNSNGNVDLLEVKKPDCATIISSTSDHNNYYATNSLSKACMQLEKYIYNLNRNIENSELEFKKKYGNQYEDDFNFRIMNPRGIIIAGYSLGYNKKQLNDLELIKRMYFNIVDIYTYNDLIQMLERIINQLKKQV